MDVHDDDFTEHLPTSIYDVHPFIQDEGLHSEYGLGHQFTVKPGGKLRGRYGGCEALR